MYIPEKYQFIVFLGKALHKYGVPSYQIQNYLEQIAKKKRIEGSFSDLPTWIHYNFPQENGSSYNFVERVPPGEWNLGALAETDEVTNAVIENKISEKEAIVSLKEIDKPSTIKKNILEAFGFAMAAGSFNIILESNWFSCFVAVIMGFLVYCITLISRKSKYINSTLETLSSFIVTLIVGTIHYFNPNINVIFTILSAIIPFVPGLAITTALEEITSRSLISGTAKLFDAFTSLFRQLFGVILAVAFLHFADMFQMQEVYDDIPRWVNHIAVVLLSISLLPSLNIRKKDAIPGIFLGVIAYNITILLWPLGVLISAFIGTVVIVIASNLISKITKTPKIVYQVQGTIMLVPGSKAFIGFSDLLVNKTNAYADILGLTSLIFMGIIGGLIFSGSFKDA